MQEYDTPGPARLVVRARCSGHVHVTTADVDTTSVELTALRDTREENDALSNASVTTRDGVVVVAVKTEKGGLFRGKSQIGIDVTLPEGSSVDVESDAADIVARGTYGEVKAKTGSGDIAVDAAEEMTLSSGSGDVAADRATDRMKIGTGSGDVAVSEAASTSQISTGSGDVAVGRSSTTTVVKCGTGDVDVSHSDGELVVKTGSGDIRVRAARQGAVRAANGSGDIAVGVVSGTAAWIDARTVTGDLQNRLDDAAAPTEDELRLELIAKTATGDIVISRV